MNEETIRHLLEKYYDGETNTDEERMLEDYFLHNEVSVEFTIDKEFFRHLAEVKKGNGFAVPEGMEKRISGSIDKWEKQSKVNNTRYYTLYKYVSGIAASVIILIGISVLLPDSKSDRVEMKDTFDNPREAYMATENALLLFAEALNKGNIQIEKAKDITLSVKEKIDNIKKIGK